MARKYCQDSEKSVLLCILNFFNLGMVENRSKSPKIAIFDPSKFRVIRRRILNRFKFDKLEQKPQSDPGGIYSRMAQ